MEDRNKMYAWVDLLAFYISLPKIDEHYHYPIQITIGLEGPFRATVGDSEWMKSECLLVKSNVPHALDLSSSPMAGIMVFPESTAGKELVHQYLLNDDFAHLEVAALESLMPELTSWGQGFTPPGQVREDSQNVLDALLSGYYRLGADKSVDPRIKQAMEIIADLPVKKISLEEMAQRVHLSPSRFRHIFKEEIGLDFRNCLLQLRMVEAMKRAESDKNLSEIAYETGFSDLAHMTKVFKRFAGITPSGYINARNVLEVFLVE